MNAEYLKDCLTYDAGTGIFTWKTRPAHHFADERTASSWNTQHAGQKAGALFDRRLRISIGNRRFYAHRLAWLYVHGVWPAKEIDHINRNAEDNRMANLREATHAENGRNRQAPPRKLPRGVYAHKRKFVARIKFNGGIQHLGVFDDKEAAHAAYVEAAKQQFGAFYNAG